MYVRVYKSQQQLQKYMPFCFSAPKRKLCSIPHTIYKPRAVQPRI